MTTVQNMYADIDIYGEESIPGNALEYFDTKAISNALNLWLTSSSGDFLRNPTAGGLLDKYLFKNLDNSSLFKIQLEITTAFKNNFSDVLALDGIQFNPDYNNRILEINVKYHDKRTGTSDNIVAYVNSDYAYKKFEYQEVSYMGENLYRFVIITLPSNSNSQLVFDSTLLKWTWSPYILTNLTYEDEYFSQILALINS